MGASRRAVPVLLAALALFSLCACTDSLDGGGEGDASLADRLAPLELYFQGLNAEDLQMMSSAFPEAVQADFYACQMEGYDREEDYWKARRTSQSALYQVEDSCALQYTYNVEGETPIENLSELEAQIVSKYGGTCTIDDGYEIHFFLGVSDGTNHCGTSGTYFDVVLLDGVWRLFWCL